MKDILFSVLCCIAINCAWTPSALAREWGSAGGWDIFEIDDNSCGMSMEYEGKGATELAIIRTTDDDVYLITTNSDWTSKQDEKYLVGYVIDNEPYVSEYLSNGSVIKYRNGFISVFTNKILDEISKGKSIDIYLKLNPDNEASEFQLIDELKLTGSSVALSRLAVCIASVKKLKAVKLAEEQRFAHLPDDPFKKLNPAVSPSQAGKSKPVGYRMYKNYGIQYPEKSFKAGLQGRVKAELTIGEAGNVSKCRIIESSGHTLLDTETCEMLNRPRRYQPALNVNGNPTEGTIVESLVWQIPAPEPKPQPIPTMKIELNSQTKTPG